EAITAYRAALHHQPGWSQAANNLAYLLATQGNPSRHDVTEAIQLAEEACYATGYENASMLGTLAVAYAAAGRRPDALRTAHHARHRPEPGARRQWQAGSRRGWHATSLITRTLECPKPSPLRSVQGRMPQRCGLCYGVNPLLQSSVTVAYALEKAW